MNSPPLFGRKWPHSDSLPCESRKVTGLSPRGDASHPQDRDQCNFALQFRTTDMGVIAVFSCVLMRNFCPSLLTS